MAASTQCGRTRAQSGSRLPESASGQAASRLPARTREPGAGGWPGGRWEQAFAGTADQLQVLRSAAGEFLAGCPVADDVVLLTHELAANAVRHSRSGAADGTFTVRLLNAPGQYVMGEVVDGGSDWDGDLHRSARDASGLYLVLALAAACGVSGGSHGRTVWFRMHCDRGKSTNPNK